MVVITLEVGESLRVGDDVIVDVLHTNGEAIKFGVVAPKGVAVHREEAGASIQNSEATLASD